MKLVCDDIVLLAEGDRVPGDMHLLESSNLAVDESLLTGESAPVLKQARPMPAGAAAVPAGSDAAQVLLRDAGYARYGARPRLGHRRAQRPGTHRQVA